MSRADYARELHRQAPRAERPRVTRRVVVAGIDATWSADHMVFNDPVLVAATGGMTAALVVIDVFSRYVWVVPQRTLTAAETWAALARVMRESRRRPRQLWLDQSTSFWAASFTARALAADIYMYSTFSSTHKACIVERVIKTAGIALWRRLTELNSKRWTDVMPDIVREYNGRVHRSLGMSPTDASRPEHETALFAKQYGGRVGGREAPPRFVQGQWVRVARLKGAFEKQRAETWSVELFRVVEVRIGEPTTYRLVDQHGEAIHGLWYASQLCASIFTPLTQAAMLALPMVAGASAGAGAEAGASAGGAAAAGAAESDGAVGSAGAGKSNSAVGSAGAAESEGAVGSAGAAESEGAVGSEDSEGAGNAAADVVVRVLGWREVASRLKFGQFEVHVEYGDGTTQWRALRDFIGKIKRGVFVPTARGADYVLAPLGDYLQSVPRLKSDVWDRI